MHQGTLIFIILPYMLCTSPRSIIIIRQTLWSEGNITTFQTRFVCFDMCDGFAWPNDEWTTKCNMFGIFERSDDGSNGVVCNRLCCLLCEWCVDRY